MSKNKRYSSIALALALLMVLSTFTVFAEVDAELQNEPQKQVVLQEAPVIEKPVVTSSIDKNVLTLSWTEVTIPAEGETPAVPASYYKVNIYNKNPDTPLVTDKKVTTGTSDTYTIPQYYDDADKDTFYYTVTAVFEDVTPVVEPVVSEEGSIANMTITAPNVYASRKHGGSDNGVNVSWDQAPAGATLEILFGNTTDVNAMSVLNTSTRPYLLSNGNSLTYVEPLGGYFYYASRVTMTVGNVTVQAVSPISSAVYVNDGFIDNLQPIMWYAKIKKNTKVYASGNGKKAIGSLKKGTTIYPDGGRYPQRVKKFKVAKRVRINYNGQAGWVNWSSTKGVKAIVNVGSDYSTSLKEYYVNAQGYSSRTANLVWCSAYTQRAYIFSGSAGNWTLNGSHRVTTGKYSQPTGARQNEIYKKKAKVFMVTEKGSRYYYKNASYFDPGVSFHTGTWWASGKKRGSVIKNGQPNTYGCIRMYDDGAAAIYRLPMHTRVICTKNLA